MKNKEELSWALVISFGFTLIIFAPILINPSVFLARGNDLTEFFWPIFYYIKQNILINHQIPYWNNMFFAGTPLLPDPQNPIWYLPNIIFLFTDIDTGILISLFVHTFFGTLGMYLTSRGVFNFSKQTSIFVACLFILSPIYFSFLEAGHWGLAISWNWLPYLLLSSYKLTNKPSWKMILLFAASASSLYFNHILTASIAGAAVVTYWLYKRVFLYPLAASLLTLLIISPALILQVSWQPQTTRSILLKYPETFPIWRGKREFIKSLFLFNPETEKAITFGVVPSLLGIYGFFKLKRQQKFLLLVLLLLLMLLVLNNVSPIYPLLIKLKPFILMRVSIRVWPIVFFILLFLFGRAITLLPRKLGFLVGILAIVESTWLGYSYLIKPISPRENISPHIYEVLEKDKTDFRVLCLTRCIPQKEAAIRNLKLVEGYGTLQELKYYYGMQEALNATWNKYSLSIPPFDVYLYQDIQPNAKILAMNYSTKYVISKHKLLASGFKLLNKFDIYYLYVNSLWKER